MAAKRGGARAAAGAAAILACLALWWFLREVPSPAPGPHDGGATAATADGGGRDAATAPPAGPRADGDRADGTAARPGTAPAPEEADPTEPYVGGRVTDSSGRPVAGARVRAIEGPPPLSTFDLLDLLPTIARAPETLAEAVTREDGRFALRGLRAGPARLVASAEGRAPAFTPPMDLRPVPGGGALIELVLGAGLPLEGRVVDGAGAGMPGVAVTVVADVRGDFPVLDRCEAVTDERGGFRVAALAPGKYTVFATAPGHPLRVEDDARVPATEPLLLRFDGTATLDVVVVDRAEKPVAGATVLVMLGRGGNAMATGATDGAGRARLERLPATKVDLAVVRAPGRGMTADQKPPELVAGGTVEWRVTLAGGTRVRGRVLDVASGEPVPGARVSATIAEGFMPSAVATATAGPDGAFLLEGVPPGKHVLVASAPGRAPPPRPRAREEMEALRFTVEEGDEEVVRDAFLERAASAAGAVLGPSDVPVGGAEVRVHGAESGWGSEFVVPAVRTGPDGRFRLDALPAGRDLALTASAAGLVAGWGSDTLRFEPGEHRDAVLLRLGAGGVVRGVVLGEGDAPLAGASVTATPDRRRGPRTGPSAPPPVTTGPDGRFVIRGAAPGGNSVRAAHVDHAEADVNVDVAEDAPVDVTLRLLPAGSVEGRVIEDGGAPVDGARISLSPEDQDASDPGAAPRRSVTSGPDGVFAAHGLPRATPYRVVVEAPGRAQGVVEGVLPGGAPLAVRLAAGLAVSGSVVDEAGTGLSRLVVTATPADGSAARTDRTDDAGRFAIRDLPAGDVTLTVAGRIPDPDLVLAPVPGVRAGAEGIVIALRRGVALAGIVRTADGAPAAKARVAAEFLGPGLAPSGTAATRCGNDGRFTIRGLPPGARYRLTAGGDGFLADGSAEAEAGAKEVALRVRVAETLSGSVTDEAGAPVPYAHVHYRRDGARYSVRCDREGKFRFPTLEAGPCEVIATPPRVAPPADGWLPARAGDEDVRLVVWKAR